MTEPERTKPSAAEAEAAEADRPWVATRALPRAVVFICLLVLAGAFLGRADLILLAAPVAIGTAAALSRRPGNPPRLTVGVGDGTGFADSAGFEGTATPVELRLVSEEPADFELAVVRFASSPWIRPVTADRPHLLTARHPVTGFTAGRYRWGRWQIGPAAVLVTACDGLLASGVGTTPAIPVKIYPAAEAFTADAAMPTASGMTGQHRSRRPGEGGEIDGIRPFTSGDRLRRVDWRVTIRTGRAHIVSTLSDREAEVTIVLDLLAECGRCDGYGGAASVLDTTVRAAAAITEHYTQFGDRVCLLEYGRMARWLRPASGRRQYTAALEWLLDVRADGCPYDPLGFANRLARTSSSGLVIALTPLLDERSVEMLVGIARSGRPVVAIDTTAGVVLERTDRPSHWAPVAERLWRVEHATTVAAMVSHGVPVVPWAGAGSLDLVLRDVARLGRAPRTARR